VHFIPAPLTRLGILPSPQHILLLRKTLRYHRQLILRGRRGSASCVSDSSALLAPPPSQTRLASSPPGISARPARPQTWVPNTILRFEYSAGEYSRAESAHFHCHPNHLDSLAIHSYAPHSRPQANAHASSQPRHDAALLGFTQLLRRSPKTGSQRRGVPGGPRLLCWLSAACNPLLAADAPLCALPKYFSAQTNTLL
jgi:hypothetical protein